MVQITQGLNQGDTVVVTGLLSVKPGVPITVNRIINAPAGARVSGTMKTVQ
jgi:hypothetical protein